MGDLFRSVMFGGRDLLMQADKGAGAGGATSTDDDDDDQDDGNQGGSEQEDGEDGEEGEEEDEEDDEKDDPLDLPQYSKRQVAQMISSRVNDLKKGYGNYKELQEVAQLIGDITGNNDINAIVASIRNLHAQHRAKTGAQPQGQQQPAPVYQPPYQPPVNTQADLKRKATENEFDNSFSKKPEFADATLFRDDIIDMVQNGFSMEQAYWAVAGPLVANKKADAAARAAEQQAQNNIRKKRTKQVMPGNTGAPGKGGKPVIPADIVAMAKKLGEDPEEYYAWSQISTFDEAQAIRGKKK